MFPNRETAIQELELAERLNPGPWVSHSYNAAAGGRNRSPRIGSTLDTGKSLCVRPAA